MEMIYGPFLSRKQAQACGVAQNLESGWKAATAPRPAGAEERFEHRLSHTQPLLHNVGPHLQRSPRLLRKPLADCSSETRAAIEAARRRERAGVGARGSKRARTNVAKGAFLLHRSTSWPPLPISTVAVATRC